MKDYSRCESAYTEKKVFEIDQYLTVGELLDILNYKQYIVVVNGLLQPHSYKLKEGDIICLIPPIVGG